MSWTAVWIAAAVGGAGADPAGAETLLLRQPDVSAREVVFAYGSDLWVAPREGGDARRLTSHPGVESYPRFSPDGAWIAFSGHYDGNVDVYFVPATGGEPRRLTWHPGPDFARGWTPDGTRVVFASGRDVAPAADSRFWTVSIDGGLPVAMPMPRAWRGQIAPDGRRVAYEMVESWETEWRNYRGGQNRPIWVLDLQTFALETLPWTDSRDTDPVFAGGAICFLSDRDFAANVYAYDAPTGTLRQLTRFREFDAKNLESGDGMLVFECGGAIHLLDPAGGEPRRLSIRVAGDFPWTRPHWEDVAGRVETAAISPTGRRALFEARGDIFTVPAEKGDVRNLTATPGVAERAPAWSPDGARIAWFSDEGGEYRLVIADQFGRDRRTVALENPTFFYTPAWSPDSRRIAFTDAGRNLWVVDAESGRARLLDDEGYAHPERTIYPEWSPDSKWLAYTRRMDNQFNAVWIASAEDGTTRPVTDGLSDCRAPAWDRGGRYLYFLGSTDYGLNVGWLDMSNYERPITRSLYLAVLSAEDPSPLRPESDDEDGEKEEEEEDEGAERRGRRGRGAAGAAEEEADEPVAVRIDFEGLARRIVPMNVPPAEYLRLAAGTAGTLFLAESDADFAEDADNGVPMTLHRYKLEERKAEKILSGVVAFAVSADGEKLLYGNGDGAWSLVDAGGNPEPEEGKLDLSGMRAKVDPPAEWRQIFREAWRYQRDFFYVRNVHGLDLDAVHARYAPLLDHLRHRADLTYLLDILGGETAVGHSFVFGGDEPDVETVPVGLLGADFTVENGRFRFARVFDGESWNPELRAPLAEPGAEVSAGEYLLAVNGVELTEGMNPYSLFDRTAGRQTVITVSGTPRMEGSREVTVVPVESETGLRAAAWVEGNRRRVDELSGGRLAYVWLPNTGLEGYRNFNRYYFAQQDREGVILDERFNQGGSAADYMIDLMARPLMGYFNNPIGDRRPFTNPGAGIWGPKVMIVNEMAGSGGDLLPWMFRFRGLGPLVGTRTWGGLVGIWDVPGLIDGGAITAPRGGFFNNDGAWDVENAGVAPDIEVEMLPAEVIAGRDPQLEKAVEVALELLAKNPVVLKSQPPDPVRARRPE